MYNIEMSKDKDSKDKDWYIHETIDPILEWLAYIILVIILGYLLYLLFIWLDFSLTEWLLSGIFIVLMFILFKMK